MHELRVCGIQQAHFHIFLSEDQNLTFSADATFWIYVPLPSACLDFGDFSSNSDLYIINMHGTLYFLGCRLAHLGWGLDQ